MGLSKISIWRGEMDMQKSIKSLKRNGILLLAYDLLVLEYSSIYSGSWIPKLGLLITEKGNVSGPIGVAKLYFCC